MAAPRAAGRRSPRAALATRHLGPIDSRSEPVRSAAELGPPTGEPYRDWAAELKRKDLTEARRLAIAQALADHQ